MMATPPEVLQGADIVHSFYGTQQPIPNIQVFEKGDCDANVPIPTGAKSVPGGKIVLPDGTCAYGTWYHWTNTIYMTMIDWPHTIAHELLHQFLNEKYGDPDHDHKRAEWATLMPLAQALIPYTTTGDVP
jgi:hypothetical protein